MNRLQEIFKRENSRRDDNPSKIEATQVFKDMTDVAIKLVKIKAAIAQANSGEQYARIARMAELKNRINLFSGLNTREGEEVVAFGATNIRTYQWKATVNKKAADEMVKEFQSEIEELQDAIDTFNAATEVAFD